MLESTDVGETANSFVTSGRDITPPDPTRLIAALRQIGYSLEQALSDLIDNSINATASTVLVRFICDQEKIVSVALADNGSGMAEKTLRNAMRFGSDRVDDAESLGKFGMGLKLASFSHAKTLTVLTRRNGKSLGRQWTLEGIERGWECQILDPREVSRALTGRWGGVDLGRNGTVVIWDRLDKLTVSSSGLRSTLQTIQRRLQTHIGVHFHRFLEAGKLRVLLDQQRLGTREHGLQVEIEPLNPFGYERSGHLAYPKVFEINLNGVGSFRAEGHIWPANAESRNYSLGHNAAARQGIYFYRNDRLIQVGGWNGIVQHDAEPHSSLARVRVDLPPLLDASFGLNVQKSAVIVPPGFANSVATATDRDGSTFEQFRHAAQKIYRNLDARAHREFPFVPGKGVPVDMHRLTWETLFPDAENVRPVDFVWEDLSEDKMFEIDQSEQTILLNKRFRSALLHGAKPSRVDAPLFKTMLLLLLEQDLFKERLSKSRKERLSRLSRFLASAIDST